jgi:MFS transporter, AAHS family, 4-hydroxybenzoate transporter
MRSAETYTVAEIVGNGGFSRPLSKIVALCFLLMVCDSYDVAALSFAAPVLIKSWALTSSFMGLVFSAGMLGLLVGSIAFGQIGDRFGRKRAMVVGAVAFSILTTATGFVQSETQLLVLRFLATIGLGGAVPNAVALIAEFSPKRVRITAVGAIFAGYSVGGILAGLSAAAVISSWGWQMMFWLGGGLSLLSAAAFAMLLPESLGYLAMHPSRGAEALRVASFLRPELHLTPTSRIESGGAQTGQLGRLADLFKGTLGLATPLMWLIYIANSMTVFGLTSWMPVAVEAIGLSRGSAAIATALLYAGSAVGGVVGGRFADRFGISTVVVMAAGAFAAVAAVGMLARAQWLLFPVSFLAGCFAFGGQTCLHGLVGSLYPTNIRANGVGWAIGIAKIGSILGPFIGGLMLPRLTSAMLFAAAASPLLLVAVLSLALRFLGVYSSAEESAAATSPVTDDLSGSVTSAEGMAA